MEISVCIPLYNAEKFIAKTIESVLAQTRRDFELLVIDDGSTDSSVEIVESYKDARIRLLKNETNGTLCELGIGTNEAAILNGIILEDEKVYGTVHIAFGTNTSFGGKNKAECHMDGIILKPTLYLDDVLVIKEGVFTDTL